MSEILFLTLAEVVEVHMDQIRRYGGQSGIRDQNLLESALAMPEAAFAGVWLHAGLYEMAAAYAFHLCQNHPFVDGNKRTALACALVFLELNGVSVLDPEQALYQAMMDVASGMLDKKTLAQILRSLPKEDDVRTN